MSRKDSYWFPHDYEPTSDPKVQALIGEYGGIGYGIYWRIVEMLHSDSNNRLPLKNYVFMAIAKQMSANAKHEDGKFKYPQILPEDIQIIISDCIKTFELFGSDGEEFWSDRILRNMDDRKKISEKRSVSGKLGAAKKHTPKSFDEMIANGKQMVNGAKQNLAKCSTGQDITGHYNTVK
jgi:hypothetical protein